MTQPSAHPRLAGVLRAPLSAALASQQPIVLHVTNNVPVELIHAAGCFPLQLPTAPRERTPRADYYLEAHFDPLVRSALEQLLAGELSVARMLVLPRTVDSWQRLYYYLCELGRSFGEQLPEPVLYDLLHIRCDSSAAYDLASTRALADKLNQLSGQRCSEAALASSIALYNRVRERLDRISELRRRVPCQLAGAEALEIITAAQRLGPDALLLALDDLLANPSETAPGTRTVLIGSAHDTPALHHMLARAGGQVVADYHWRGDLAFGPHVREDLAPLEAIAEHYQRDSLSVRSYPLPIEPLLELALARGARAAAFFYYAEEEALTWDYPEHRAALEARGIRTIAFMRESYPPSPELEEKLRAFFATLARSERQI